MICCFSKPKENIYSELERGSIHGEEISTTDEPNQKKSKCCWRWIFFLCSYFSRRNHKNSPNEVTEQNNYREIRTLLDTENQEEQSVIVRAYDCNDSSKRKFAMAFMAVE